MLQKANRELVRQTQWDRIAHFVETETLRRETESSQSHLGETEIPIGETEVTRVSGSGYVK